MGKDNCPTCKGAGEAKCGRCGGSGINPNSNTQNCTQCAGTGLVICPTCHGTGNKPK